MTQETYEIRAFWGSRPESAADCAARLRHLIDKLAPLDSVFVGWHRGATAIDVSALEELFADSRSYYNYPPDKAMPKVGFLLTLWGHSQADPVGMHIHAGAYGDLNGHRNSIALDLTKNRALTSQPWKASELRPVLCAVIDAWDVGEASIDCNRYLKYLRSYLLPSGKSRLYSPREGWVTYLPSAQAKMISAPKEVEVERLDNGGVLYTLCEEPFTIDNPKHRALAAAMQKALAPIQKP